MKLTKAKTLGQQHRYNYTLGCRVSYSSFQLLAKNPSQAPFCLNWTCRNANLEHSFI